MRARSDVHITHGKSRSASFSIPLSEALTESQVHYINKAGMEIKAKGETQGIESTQCLGSAAAPQAEPGNLCVYEAAAVGVTEFNEEGAASEIFPAGELPPSFGGHEAGAGTSGAGILFGVLEPEITYGSVGWGTWAVTAEA